MSDVDPEPQAKRQKLDPTDSKYKSAVNAARCLQKNRVLAVGQKETLKLVQAKMTSGGCKTLVFVLHDKEHDV